MALQRVICFVFQRRLWLVLLQLLTFSCSIEQSSLTLHCSVFIVSRFKDMSICPAPGLTFSCSIEPSTYIDLFDGNNLRFFERYIASYDWLEFEYRMCSLACIITLMYILMQSAFDCMMSWPAWLLFGCGLIHWFSLGLVSIHQFLILISSPLLNVTPLAQKDVAIYRTELLETVNHKATNNHKQSRKQNNTHKQKWL